MKISYKTILFFFLFCNLAQMNAQFFRGVGFFLGETTSRHRYKNKYPIPYEQDPTFLHAKPPSHKGSEYESWSVGAFVEMLPSDVWRWQSEIEYMNRGSRENVLLDPILNTKVKATNHLSYIQWNNFLKRYVDLGLRYRTYLMIGARIEYNLTKSVPAYSYVAGGMPKIWFNPDAALGIEIPLRRGWSMFVEEHYNPDVLKQVSLDGGKIWLMNRTWETRVGLIYRWKRGIGAYDLDCNAPRYHGR
jgi:hypothetical protein